MGWLPGVVRALLSLSAALCAIHVSTRVLGRRLALLDSASPTPGGLWRGKGGAFTDQPSSWRWSSSPLLGRVELLATARAAALTVRSLRDPHRKDFLFPSAEMAHFGTF